ncbi:SPOR domain-containing protein [Methylobacterium sp. NEAU 140]|uniref:SPOR domain-containing protein n=1 Tax=Methylobacterium sp. NEAU 140 TaxID=3064945 RepID=UPI002735DC21|nr:SPOR domain-containing protein [Methylobacterium sp. NEAU 140]MDP4025888.1 SPOR domain-containing protein [Methylobacterium sp. NEAU 140]
MTNASRAPVDLDAIARDLRHDTGQPRAANKADPLAELARIVGQDDPFRALLAARGERGDGQGQAGAAPDHASPDRRGPEHGGPEHRGDAPGRSAEPPAWDAGRVEPRFASEPPRANPADAFDQYLASVEQDTHAESGHGTAAAGADEAYADDRALRRVRPRRRLASVAAGVGVVAVAIAGALTYKGLHGGGSGGGGVPVVQADTAPLKVAPKVADGVEIPDQNRQIYDRKPAAKDGQIRIVNREEQPLDVAEAARAAQGGTAAAGQGTTPGSGPFEAFGEPRRVRTVAVKPDAPPALPPRDAQAQVEAGPSPIPTMTLPTDQPAAKPARPTRSAAAAPMVASVPTQAPAEAAPVQEAPPAAPVQAAPKAAAAKTASKATQRVAAVSPETTAATTEPAAESPAVSDGPVGGFAVQLGVRGSAAEARAAFREMQGKYGQLAGKPELIRQAEVNGKTIYRVRVGPLAKAEAASLCSALQGAGGQCFVAKN